METQQPELIRRKVPLVPGVFVRGGIQGVDTWFTIDTGASRSVISKRVFNNISGDMKPELVQHQNSHLEQAGGEPLHEYGRGKMNIEMGELSKPIDVIVGVIKDDVLLGIDVGVLDMLMSKGQVQIDGHSMSCVQIQAIVR